MSTPSAALRDLITEPLANGRSVKDQPGGFPVLRLTSLRNGTIDLQQRKEGAWSRADAERFLVRAGDFLVSRGNGSLDLVGRGGLVAVDPDEVAFPDTMIRVRPDTTRVEPRFLALVWSSPSIRRQIESSARTTAGIYKVNQTGLGAIAVPLPPLQEQRRIVDLLEDHLSRLDAAESYLDAALRRVEMLRWGSVAEAVTRAGGREVRLGDIASVRNGIFVSRPGSEPNGVPILRIGAVRSLSLDLSDLRYSERTEQDLREADGIAQPGDLLFTRYNGNHRFVGACAAVPDDAPVLTYPDKLIRVRVTDDAALSEFVALACSVGAARAEIQASVRTTAGQAGIAGRDLKNVTVTVPDLEAQRAAIRAASESGLAANRLSHELEIAQRRTAALRRSLLAAAFSGRLTRAESDLSAAEEMVNT